MIMVAMGDSDSIQFFTFHEVVKRQALASLAFGMNTGVEEEAVSFDLDKPG